MEKYYNQVKNSPVFFGLSEDELKQMLEIDDNAVTLVLAKRKLELKAKSADNSLLKNAMLNLKKNKEAGL